jgi:GAF domain-containing protein/DNA-binding CsgD family transcriptional regulator
MRHAKTPRKPIRNRLQTLENELKDYHTRLMRVRRLQQVYTGFVADPRKNMEVIVENAAKLLGVPTSLYNRYCDRSKRLTAFTGYNLPNEFERESHPEGHICYEEIIKGENVPVVFEDLMKTPYAETDPAVKRFGLKAYLGYPVSLEGKVRGSLCVVDVQRRSFADADVKIVSTLARALSLEEERLETEKALKKKIRLQRMLADISTKAISVTDKSEFLQDCLTIMGDHLDVGGIFLWINDAQADTLSNIAEWLQPGVASNRLHLQNIPSAQLAWGVDLLKNGDIINFADIEACPEGGEKEIMRRVGVKSVLILPLLIKTDFFGCIGFEEYTHHREWTAEDINILTTAAQIMTKAIEGKMAEDALLEANRTLEGRVRRRTESLERTTRQLKERQSELLRHKNALEKVNRELIDTNKAVTVLARNIEKQKREIEFKVSRIVSSRILPLMEKALTNGNLNKARYDLDLAVNYLKELIDGFSGQASSFMNLTETEARIAGMIKKGMTSEAVSKSLNISVNTVKTHRKNIRRKLRVQNARINLKNYLKTTM